MKSASLSPVPLLFWSSLLRFISLYPIHFLTEMNCVKGEDTKKHVFLQWCSLSHKSTLALRLMPSFKHPVINGSWDLTVQWVPAGPGFTAPHRNAWTIWHSNWSLQIYRSSCTTAETTPPCSSTGYQLRPRKSAPPFRLGLQLQHTILELFYFPFCCPFFARDFHLYLSFLFPFYSLVCRCNHSAGSFQPPYLSIHDIIIF